MSYLKLLEQVQAEAKEFDEHVEEPCSEPQIEKLSAKCEKLLSAPLPPGYADFLRRSNGLDFNGLVIYAAQRRKEKGGVPFLEGFIEANQGRRDVPEMKNWLLVGDSDNEEYGWNLGAKRYELLDKSSASLVKAFRSFDAMLAEVLKKRLED